MSNPVMNRALQQLLGAVFPTVKAQVGEWDTCTVHARMRCEQPAVDILVGSTVTGEHKEEDEKDNATTTILIPDYQTSGQIMTAVKAIWSQRGGRDMGAPWSAIHFKITKDGKMTMQFDAVEDDEEEDGKNNGKYLQQVYDARTKLYKEKFGNPLPELIIKMNHFFVIWPLGGLIPFKTSVLGEERHVMTTFGLSNPDMPAKLKTISAPGGKGNIIVNKGQHPLPRVGMAGYGYELLIITKHAEEWPKSTLQWACSNELLADIEFLGRVEELDGITAGNVPAGDKMVNVLIAPARDPLPISEDLPNGKMKFLVLTVITEHELQFSLEHGRVELLNLLHEKGEGQLSDLERKSVDC